MDKIIRATTEEQIKNRKDEIIEACYKTYLDKGFIGTSIKDISEKLSFARSSIYNYYQTKEEIFLDLLRNEYEMLNEDLNKIYEYDSLTKEMLATLVSQAIAKRITLLSIISTTLNELEKNSRIEYLIDFKKSYAKVLDITQKIIEKFTDLDSNKVDTFMKLFFPFLFGLCAFTIVSEKQLEAMEKAGIKWEKRTTEQLCFDFIINALI